MFSDYDNWKTTDPRDSEPGIPDGAVLCEHCNGEGCGRDEDGPWCCSTCNGDGWVYPAPGDEVF